MATMENNTQLGEDLSYDPPILHKLLNLLNVKGMKLLHQNIQAPISSKFLPEDFPAYFDDIC